MVPRNHRPVLDDRLLVSGDRPMISDDRRTIPHNLRPDPINPSPDPSDRASDVGVCLGVRTTDVRSRLDGDAAATKALPAECD